MKLKKSILIVLSVASMAILAKGYVDAGFMSNSFMADDEIKMAKRLDDSHQRYVASYEQDQRTKLDFPVNSANMNAINKVWLVTAYTYNFGQSEKLNRKLAFELVGNGRVMIAGDEELTYDMVRFEKNQIRLVKEVDGGHEIIDAVLEQSSVSAASIEVKANEQGEQQGVPGLAIAEDIELVLVKVSNVTKKDLVQSAELSITAEGKILYFNVNGTNFEAEEIRVGGLFNGDFGGENVSGRISNDGSPNKYSVRFFTGALQGAVLHLENSQVAQVEEVQVEIQNENKVESRREISVEEMEMNAMENGFDFSNN